MTATQLAATTPPAALPVPRAPSSTGALAALAFSMLLSSLGTSIANVGLPTLARIFTASFQEVQWVVLAYLLAITALIVGVGRLGDLAGRRRLLLAGVFLFTIASTLCGLAPTLRLLAAARGAQGLGAAVMMALALALVSEVAPKEKTGRVMGLLGTMSAIGTALGPSLGGFLIAGFGWRAMFFANVPLGVLTFLLAQRHLPADLRPPATRRVRFDYTGTLLLALSLGAYALALTTGRGHFGARNAALLFAAAVGAGFFVLAEARSAFPLVRLTLFRDAALSGSLAMSGLVSTVVMTTLVVGPFYLSRSLGLDAAAVGLVLSVGPVVAALTGVPAGRMADRFGASRTTLVGLLGLAAGSLSLALLPATFGIFGYLLPVVVLTAGYGLFQTANNTAVMKAVSPEQRGVVSGLLNLSRNLGLVTGASLMGAVFTFGAGTIDLAAAEPQAAATGLRITFAVAAALIVVALVLAGSSIGPIGPMRPIGPMVSLLSADSRLSPASSAPAAHPPSKNPPPIGESADRADNSPDGSGKARYSRSPRPAAFQQTPETPRSPCRPFRPTVAHTVLPSSPSPTVAHSAPGESPHNPPAVPRDSLAPHSSA
jgi:EmrB/QacA subfamily drug resistance transporter